MFSAVPRKYGFKSYFLEDVNDLKFKSKYICYEHDNKIYCIGFGIYYVWQKDFINRLYQLLILDHDDINFNINNVKFIDEDDFWFYCLEVEPERYIF